MGLYKKNYELKNFGIVIPEAYAVITSITQTRDNEGIATFTVNTSREKCFDTCVPLETEMIHFKCERGANPYEAAYLAAQTDTIDRVQPMGSDEIKEIVVNAPFKGWEDDRIIDNAQTETETKIANRSGETSQAEEEPTNTANTADNGNSTNEIAEINE